MEDRGRHRIGISQNQSHINADVATQKQRLRMIKTEHFCRSL
jgi:hypothetical protein